MKYVFPALAVLALGAVAFIKKDAIAETIGKLAPPKPADA